MQQTSILAYRSLSPEKISNRQQQVLDTLEKISPACNRQVAAASQIPINVVTPRMGELVKKGLVEKAYIAQDISGKQVIYWQPRNV